MRAVKRGLPAGLLALILGLSVVIAFQITRWRQDVAADPSPAPVMALNRQVSVGLSEAPGQYRIWLNQILARPLFSPDRHPVEVGVRGLPRLTGIVVDGAQRVAIFAAASGEHPIVAQAGTHLGTYEVRDITDAGVTVTGPEGTTLVRPVFDVARQIAPPSPVRPQLPIKPGTR